jgi:hypothetical protein
VLFSGERSFGGFQPTDEATGSVRALQYTLETDELRHGHGYLTTGANGLGVLDQALQEGRPARIGLHELGEAKRLYAH